MSRRKNKTKQQSPLKQEILSIFVIAVGILILISLQTESTGELGKFIKFSLMGLLSIPSYILPYFIILLGVMSFSGKTKNIDARWKLSLLVLYLGYIMLYTIYHLEDMAKGDYYLQTLMLSYEQGVEGLGGGLIGTILTSFSIKLLGINGSYVIIITLMIAAIILLTGISLNHLLKTLKQSLTDISKSFISSVIDFIQVSEEKVERKKEKPKKFKLLDFEESEVEVTSQGDAIIDEKIKILDFTRDNEKPEPIEIQQQPERKPVSATAIEDGGNSDDTKLPINISNKSNVPLSYTMPDLSLLDDYAATNSKNDKKEIMQKVKILEETMQNFGVDAKVMQVSKGPTITRYEIQPSPGVKVSKIVSLSDDIALNLAASNIRIEAPIPGKAAVGIEIPNDSTTTVSVKEVLESDKYTHSDSKLTFVLGKDIAGNPVTADLAKMPHMLIAGATGSGKSVCINTLITSILFKATPDEVRLVLIDPKVVELNNYNGIPHLLIPVVTEPKKAASALNWAVQEMTNRYKLFAQNGVRDINSYNEKQLREENEALPKIVVIIDELADLMMVAPGQVEDAICRLAQMARAAGIHLIVATQRPSVDVITGVIKANIPSRIAFAVSSQADSRTILDMGGAEKLLGKGDLLFYPVGASKPRRLQGAFISDAEVEKVVSFIKQQVAEAVYEEDILEKIETELPVDEGTVDELLQEAIEFVVQTGQASISMLQRRFRIGYNRAARLIDAMEERGIVGEHEGSKPRQVRISKEEFEEIKSRV
ncbi:FtsK/SpoIIIE family DNA translocase [Geosporobacter ferrireducens]|uniref:FtsK/SpoIIIE family DNA translocase n=1 Tax=Geosporobacter ferrireducens TaxID=1424294 RepID=UPI00139DD312|nr:DNA translocase FtsK [Geosporobacter ferrireducens]MTI57359.1 DNA translocase FtsK [Geosporobacter ferrireducens]